MSAGTSPRRLLPRNTQQPFEGFLDTAQVPRAIVHDDQLLSAHLPIPLQKLQYRLFHFAPGVLLQQIGAVSAGRDQKDVLGRRR